VDVAWEVRPEFHGSVGGDGVAHVEYLVAGVQILAQGGEAFERERMGVV
jgi:hypothetical protein